MKILTQEAVDLNDVCGVSIMQKETANVDMPQWTPARKAMTNACAGSSAQADRLQASAVHHCSDFFSKPDPDNDLHFVVAGWAGELGWG